MRKHYRSPFNLLTRAGKIFPLVLATVVAIGATSTLGILSAQSVSPVSGQEQVAAKQGNTKKAAPADTHDKTTPDGKTPAKVDPKVLAAEIDASIASAARVDPMDLMKNPHEYMNKKVTFIGTFNRFADVGLDYKKALRDSRDYVSFFILRPDVAEHTIPLSEMKLFFPRKKSDEVMDLEAGDKIQIVGTEFSTALEEPWVDVEHIKILEKTTKPERKHAPEF